MKSSPTDHVHQEDLLEEWRPLVASSERFEPYSRRYDVSSLGRVRNRRTGHVLKPWVGPRTLDPYLRAGLSGGPGQPRVTCWVHHVVAEAFLGPRPEGWYIDHLDGDKEHNAASNLEYVTPGENHQRAIAGGNGGGWNHRRPRAEDLI